MTQNSRKKFDIYCDFPKHKLAGLLRSLRENND